MRSGRRRAVSATMRLALALGFLLGALGWPVLATPPVALAAQENPSDWVDPFFAEQMERLHVPGAVFVLVKDGRVLHARGYGLADRARGTPVDPDLTVFPVMSVSKLFTATAIMQLVEQGRVRLDADVNRYLTSIEIPDTYPQPVTIAQLLTHTAGFDHDVEDVGTTARRPDDALPLRQYLTEYPPVRIQPPGQHYLYSNVAYDLLGLIVEDVSGQSFPAYLDQHVLRPLGMDRSSFAQRELADRVVSYRWRDGAFQPMEPHYFSNTPSAGLQATGSDIARFIHAQLAGGLGANGARVLQESTVARMQQRQFGYHPGLPGMAYGFSTLEIGNHRELGHEGWGLYRLRSRLALFPEQSLGYFVAISSAGDDSGLIDALHSRIRDHYAPLPAPPPPPSPPADFDERAGSYAGVYRATDFSRHTIAKAVLLRGDPGRWVTIAAPGDGTLTLRFGSESRSFVLVEAAEGVFRVQGFHYPVVFRSGADGEPGYLNWGSSDYEKVPWYETGTVQQYLGAGFAGIFLLAVLGLPILSLARRAESPARIPAARLAGLNAWLVATLNLIFLVGFAVTLSRAYEIGLEYGLPPVLVALLLVPLLTTALTAGLVIWTVLLWRRRIWSVPARLAFSAVAVTALAFIPFLRYWNLLGALL